jgi:curli biogenesis system outer membrane secretion channel CsgG
MKTVLIAVFVTIVGVASAFAQETCASKAVSADGKPLAGAAKKSFVQKCKKDACEPKAVDSSGKALKGAAKKSFLTKCEKDA